MVQVPKTLKGIRWNQKGNTVKVDRYVSTSSNCKHIIDLVEKQFLEKDVL